MDDLKQIKQMLWALNCKLEALSHKDDFVLQNGILVPKEAKGTRNWNGGLDWSFPMTTTAHEDKLKKAKEQKWKAISTNDTPPQDPNYQRWLETYQRMVRSEFISGTGRKP